MSDIIGTLALGAVGLLAVWLLPKLWTFVKPPANLPPGPKSWDFFRGQSMVIINEPPVEPQLRWAKEYGPLISYTSTLGQLKVCVADPEMLKEILVTKAKDYPRDERANIAVEANIGGVSLLTAPDVEHRRERKAAAPAFRFETLKLYTPAFVRHSQELVEKWNAILDKAEGESTEIELSGHMKNLTLDIIGDTGFGFNFNSLSDHPHETVEAYHGIFDMSKMSVLALLSLMFPMLRHLPFKSIQHSKRCLKTIQNLVQEMIKEEREKGDGELSNNLLGHLIEFSDKQVTDSELTAQIITFAIAGHETTSNSLCWWFQFMSKHPDVLAKVREEMIAVLGGSDDKVGGPTRAPTFEDLKELVYTEATIRESLRLYPALAIAQRCTGKDVTLGGYHIPKGTHMFLAFAVMHRLESIFDEPERFNPERWMGDNAKKYSHYSWLSFGAGQRSCIGNRFAMLEMKTILSMIVPRFNLKSKEGFKVRPTIVVTMGPADGMPMTLSRA